AEDARRLTRAPPLFVLLRPHAWARAIMASEATVAKARKLGVEGKGESLAFRAVFVRDGKWFMGSSPDLPGAFSQEKTLDKARVSLLSAARELLELEPELAKKLKRLRGSEETVREVLSLRLG